MDTTPTLGNYRKPDDYCHPQYATGRAIREEKEKRIGGERELINLQ
jgi:hypothetical protein